MLGIKALALISYYRTSTRAGKETTPKA